MKKELYLYTAFSYVCITMLFLAAYVYFDDFKNIISFIKSGIVTLPNVIAFIVGIVMHEFIHYFSFRVLGVNKNKVTIGFSIKNMMPYVHCKQAVSRKVYLIAAISPFILLAILPLFTSLYLSSTPLFIFSLIMAKGSSGDLASIILVLIKSSRSSKILDSKNFGFEVS